MKHKSTKYILAGAIVGLTLALGACAKQGYPSGGPRDTQPPTPGRCKPANASYNFDARQFYIEFDEYVVLKDPDNNILVSPPMQTKPEYSTRGKGVLVKIKDTLQRDATYLFQFKNAIADFTEGNLLPSYEYVFATGTRMDTLKLGGRVLDARTGKPSTEVVTVMAFAENGKLKTENGEQAGDSIPRRPSFVTRCDKAGGFQFHYIPQGQYTLVALVDADRNLAVGEAETVGWDEQPYAAQAVVDTASAPTLRLSTPSPTKQMVTASEFTGHGRFRIVTRLPMQQPAVQGAEGRMQLNVRADTLTFWLMDPKCDSAQVVFTDQGASDTLRLRYRAPSTSGKRRRGKNAEPTVPLMRSLCAGNTAYYDRLQLAFENPIATMADSAYATVMNLTDSSLARYPLALDSSGLHATIVATLASGQNYSVYLAPGLFTDMYGTPTDSLRFSLQPKDYATLSVELANHTGSPLVVQLADSRDTVVASMPVGTEGGSVRFDHVGTGEYRLRAVVDADANGRWTPGSYALRRQPEEVIAYPKALNLREKWEVREKWTVENGERRTENGE